MKEKKGIIITVVVAVIVLGVLSYALATRHKANEPKTTGNQETVKMTETAASESAVSPAAVVTEETPAKDIYKDYFLVGAAINGSDIDTMAIKHKGMAKILKENFNSTTLSNLMKPEYLLDEKATKKSKDGMPVCKFDTCDPALKFCQENGIKMRGHTLLWHNQTPSWLFYKNYDVKSGKLADAKTMAKRMESYIKQVITHCQK